MGMPDCDKINKGQTAVLTSAFALLVLSGTINRLVHSEKKGPSCSAKVRRKKSPEVVKINKPTLQGREPSARVKYWMADTKLTRWYIWIVQGLCHAVYLSGCLWQRGKCNAPWKRFWRHKFARMMQRRTHPLNAAELLCDSLTPLQASCWPGGCSAPTARWTQAGGCARVWRRRPDAC